MKKLIPATVLLLAAGGANAQDIVWQNLEKYPSSLVETGDGWSAIRSESGEISHRIAADDFSLKSTTKITKIQFWTVEILQNPLVGVDWYIYSGPAEGPPGDLIAHGEAVKTPHEDTGLVNNSFGTLFLETATPEDLVLPAGHYFLAFRVVQELPEGQKGIGSLTTRWTNGTSRGWWNFDVFSDGAVAGPWVPMEQFNLEDNEWAFQLEGVAACYADCEADGDLDIDDFVCFQTLFAFGDTYADCEADGDLDIDDFICLQTAFAIGCE